MEQATRPRKVGKKPTSIVLADDVQIYLEDLASQLKINRSWLINAIVRQHQSLVRAGRIGAIPTAETASST